MKKKLWMMLMCGCLVLSGCGGEEKNNEEPTPTVGGSGGLLDNKEDGQGDNKGQEGSEGGGLLNSAGEANAAGAYWDPRGSVELGQYLGIEVEKIAVEVTEEEVQEEIDYFLYMKSDLVEVEGQEFVLGGDWVNIDYTLTVGGEEIDSYEGYNVEVGSDSFDFETYLIGMRVGESKEVTLIIADGYYDYSSQGGENYVGKQGVYNFTVNMIQEEVLPELTDELVAENTDYATVEEYRQGVYDELYASKEQANNNQQVMNAFQKIMDASVFSGINDKDIQSYVDETVSNCENYASMYGLSVEDFLSFYAGNISYDEFVQKAKEEGEYTVKQNLILKTVIEKESLALTDAEYTEGLSSYAANYDYDSPEEFEADYGKAEIENALLLDKAYNLIVDSIVVK